VAIRGPESGIASIKVTALEWRVRVAGWLPRRRLLPGVVTFIAITMIAFAYGGFAPRVFRLSLLALLALVAAALVGRDRIPFRRREWLAVAALAAFAAWTAASSLWSSSPEGSILEGERTAVYVAGLLVVLVGVARMSLPQVLVAAVAGATAVCAYSLVKRVVSPPPLDPFQGRLLFEPFGYANALGVFAAIAIILAAGLALSARRGRDRLAAAASLVVLLPALLLTSSRGAWVALPIGALAMLYVSGRIRLRVALLSLLTAGLVVGILLGTGITDVDSIAGENRPRYWRVAWDDFESNPLLGSGAGTFGSYWLSHRPATTGEFAHDAHSLYLETLAELGLVGLVLLLPALALPLIDLRQRRDGLLATAAGGYVVFLVHAGIDWDWEMPAVTLAGLLCGGAVLVGTRPADVGALSPRARAALFLGAIALAAVASLRLE
jgi:O-antigen ligase